MYTVNGQYYPTITFQPGAHQIWRIANLSASATYVVQLVDDATGQPQVLNVLALGGLVAGTSTPGGTDLKVGVKLKNLLLLPASRAEVFVPNVAGTKIRPMTLHTTGITTGPAGDPWPQIDLARVVMQPYATGQTPQTAADPTLLETDAAAIPLNVTLPNAAHTLSPVIAPVAGTAPVNCVTLPLDTTVRRRVTFSETPTEFELQSEVVRPNGTPIDAIHTIGPEQFPMAAATAPNSVPHVCPRLGTREVWELVNTTQELHNFHIHQTKFRLSVQSDPGVPANLVAVQDPSGLIAQYEPETQGAVPDADVDMWHDTLPVPPASLDGKTPGRTFVTIPFFATQQIGDFVFHCHYLDHEDGGMMAIAQVWDPTAMASTDPVAQLASLMTHAICALPRATR
jgi:FtsP/CotA-like multicopper oxidase with cupredoxin domain